MYLIQDWVDGEWHTFDVSASLHEAIEAANLCATFLGFSRVIDDMTEEPCYQSGQTQEPAVSVRIDWIKFGF